MFKNTLIYLASPYSHSDPAVMQQRFEQVCEATAGLLRAGYMVYSPIVHSHPLTKYGLPTDWAYWEQLDTQMIEMCGALVILMLDGWDESTGVTNEIGKAVEMLTDDQDMWLGAVMPEECTKPEPEIIYLSSMLDIKDELLDESEEEVNMNA